MECQLTAITITNLNGSFLGQTLLSVYLIYWMSRRDKLVCLLIIIIIVKKQNYINNYYRSIAIITWLSLIKGL